MAKTTAREGMLMDANVKAKVPAIRFKGFDGSWQQDVLGNMASFAKGQGYSKSDLCDIGTPIILYGRLYTNYQTGIYEVNTFAQEKYGSVKSKGNEVIVPASGETAEDIARASAVLKSDIVLGGDLNIIYPNENLNPYFLSLTLSNGKPQRELARKAQGKSVVHVRNSDLQSLDVSHPKVNEQKKISCFFERIDISLEYHQDRLDKLNNLKQAMLQKMFPQGDTTVPEIRFQGFTGEWSRCQLSSISDIVGGGTPSTAVSSYWGGDIDWYSPTEIGTTVYADGSVKKITKEGLENSSAKILPANRTILFTSRAGIGDVAILRREGCTNQGFQSLVLHEGVEPYFVYSMAYLIKEYALKYASGSTFLEISSKQLGNMPLLFPNKEEQQKIGNYFRGLDELIALERVQLDKLKQIKQACLAGMFV